MAKDNVKQRLGWISAAVAAVGGLLIARRLREGKRPPAVPGTALITGASSGIGAAFARRLAADGYDLVLVARRAERLQALATELRPFGVRVEVLPADLAQDEAIGRVAARIRALPDLALLINNAGFGVSDKFTEADAARHAAMIQVHATAPTRLCHAALPGMVARRRGAIINVSSVAAFFPTYTNTVYGASKAYLNVFSEALQAGVKKDGVRVQALCPGYTVTEFHDTAEMEGFDRERVPQKMWMSAEKVAAISLDALKQDKVIVVPGRRNRLIVFAAQNGLASILLRIYRRLRRRS